MNYLAHLLLAPPTPHGWLGSLLADFAGARALARYPTAVQHAVQQHRAIDAFTDRHPLPQQSRRRLGRDYRLVGGVMVDIFYDHFLARHWARYAELSLGEFCRRVYDALARCELELPPRLAWVLPRMAAQDWLGSYAEIDNIELALGGVARRLSRPTRLAHGAAALRQHYAELEADFLGFFPELAAHAGELLDSPAGPGSSPG